MAAAAIECIAETGSTNAELLQRLRCGESLGEGYWLQALRQTAGRGRLGRAWVSEAGNLYSSTIVVLGPDDPPPHSLTFVTSLAVYDALRSIVGAKAPIQLKWPNDVEMDGAKISGILLERAGGTVVVGIGINVAHTPELESRRTTAISHEITGPTPGPGDVLHLLAQCFADRLAQWRTAGLAAIIADWSDKAHALGEIIAVSQPGGERLNGSFAGVEPDGALRLRLADGRTTQIYAGDVGPA